MSKYIFRKQKVMAFSGAMQMNFMIIMPSEQNLKVTKIVYLLECASLIITILMKEMTHTNRNNFIKTADQQWKQACILRLISYGRNKYSFTHTNKPIRDIMIIKVAQSDGFRIFPRFWDKYIRLTGRPYYSILWSDIGEK